jgi:hypothetical protein
MCRVGRAGPIRRGAIGLIWICLAMLVVAACGSSGSGTGKVKLAEKHVSDA